MTGDPLSRVRTDFGRQVRKARQKTPPNLTEIALRQRRGARGRPPNAGLSQAELARRLGISQSRIASIERGGGAFTSDYASRIAEALGREIRIVLLCPGD